MSDVFISYKKEDRQIAELVARGLEQNRLRVWWDTRLLAGDSWDEVIRRELEAARSVVVLWSHAAWSSRWVQAEAQDAFGRDILVAARLDDVQVRVPFNLIQIADLSKWNQDYGSPAFAQLVEGVRSKVKRTQVSSVAELERRSTEGDPAAQYSLGLNLLTKKDLIGAVELFQRASDSGLAAATFQLALAFERGSGVERNLGRALALHRAAAAAGHVRAQVHLAYSLNSGTNFQRDVTESATWWKAAAESNDRDAQYEFARMLELGETAACDKREAMTWYERSAANGSARAATALNRLRKRP